MTCCSYFFFLVLVDWCIKYCGFRLLGLVFGVTVYSATTVLASFMSGLAIGSFVADKLMPKNKKTWTMVWNY